MPIKDTGAIKWDPSPTVRGGKGPTCEYLYAQIQIQGAIKWDPCGEGPTCEYLYFMPIKDTDTGALKKGTLNKGT